MRNARGGGRGRERGDDDEIQALQPRQEDGGFCHLRHHGHGRGGNRRARETFAISLRYVSSECDKIILIILNYN